jgi:hypothetical protein
VLDAKTINAVRRRLPMLCALRTSLFPVAGCSQGFEFGPLAAAPKGAAMMIFPLIVLEFLHEN